MDLSLDAQHDIAIHTLLLTTIHVLDLPYFLLSDNSYCDPGMPEEQFSTAEVY